MFDVFYFGPKPNLFAFEKPAASLAQAAQQCRTNYFWYINGYNDYTNFDFYFQPPPWEAEFTHVWPSQWQQNGGTYFCAKNVIEHKWHWQQQVVPRNKSAPIFYLDHYNVESHDQYHKLRIKYVDVKNTRYIGTHLDVLQRIMNQATTEYIWVASSICNYDAFDFTWHPSQWQDEMIHCFGWSNYEKNCRGDTFYIHVESFRKQMCELELLDWFKVINYNKDQLVYYFNCPTVIYKGDNLVEAIKNYDFKFPYALFKKTTQHEMFWDHYMCLWAEKDRQVVPYTADHSECLVPKDIKQYLKTQIYDYPYLQINDIVVHTSPKLDVIFISNNEPDAEQWYKHCSNTIKENRLVRIQNVKGRENAYKAAALASETDWFFAVFAKLEVSDMFDWDWQPDYWQEPKHYIFHALNPLNNLVYGHQAMIAYNKRLVLETVDAGLDFTLSQAHTVVPILSGTAHFNQDPWTTWRTAFREVVKLKYFAQQQTDVETLYRLKKWTTVANGRYSDWCLQGANDAVDYFDNVDGDYAKLKLTYEWQWLKDYANSKGYNF